MAFNITKVFLMALCVATWVDSLPTMTGEISDCGRELESNTNTSSILADCSGLSGDIKANNNAVSNDITDPSTVGVCFESSCCGMVKSCHKVGKCFDSVHCFDPSGCDMPGLSASATSTFTCAPTQTCATSLITTGSPPSFLTLACFDIRTRIAEVEPGAVRVTPMPERGLEDPDPVSDLAYHVNTPLVSQVLTDVDTYPFITITEVYASTSSGDAALATDIPLSSSADRTGTVTLTTQKSSTSASRWQTTVQPTPANTSSNSTPGARGPSRTAIVAGGLFGTIAFLALSITSVDFLVRRRKKNRCRHSFPSSSSSDNEALEHKKEEPQMPAYGYYGTNRAGTIPKGSKALEASAEPVELPAEGVADHRE
ncbi:hypothetical protein VSDG_01701 [Cytospora chrysosperma]|uniref:Mid2 domain-containing protein n=1 Tax=Cytospora chrysosperma TaxID=252740 RepID=A0A423WHB0_CYTCH|nr:hypothetical protein VSDG_01701 [Valsa sordida]